ncbi:MAG TPA: tetratricopeptide repeat protein [Acidobacteriaceae bacterium]|nr:tetratricopeptide repeat protein [Acidobacteriaceae bacterium]
MASVHAGTILTPEERLARRNLILRDAASLLTLFLITAVIFVLTLLLFRSFTNHQQELGARWKVRGETALRTGHPAAAIEALRSALAYVPSRDTEIELATALADAGKLQEASVYFTTLWESAPGDGTINLQLARLAVKEGNEDQAILHYQSALDGTWQGNGYDRRREVRLEMTRYLVSRGEYSRARSQLLIAAGNAPDDPAIKLDIAGLLEQAHAPQDALGIYRSLIARRDPPMAAFEGAGRTAFALGMYRVAADSLSRAVASPFAAHFSNDERTANRAMLDTSLHVLDLDAAFDLAPRVRAERVLSIRKLARQRLSTCMASVSPAPATLASVAFQWAQLPSSLTVQQLERQQDLEQTVLQLGYQSEIATEAVCGEPTGDDALLLRIARNPQAVEQQ